MHSLQFTNLFANSEVNFIRASQWISELCNNKTAHPCRNRINCRLCGCCYNSPNNSMPLHNTRWKTNWLSGILTLLKYPYPRDVEEPEKYETVRVHAEWGKTRDKSIRDKGSLAVSNALKFSNLFKFIEFVCNTILVAKIMYWNFSDQTENLSLKLFFIKIATREGYLTKQGGMVKVSAFVHYWIGIETTILVVKVACWNAVVL